MEVRPGALEAWPRSLEARPGVMKARPEAMEARSGAMEAHPEAVDACPGAMGACPGAMEARPRQGWAKLVLIALERYSVALKRLTFNLRYKQGHLNAIRTNFLVCLGKLTL